MQAREWQKRGVFARALASPGHAIRVCAVMGLIALNGNFTEAAEPADARKLLQTGKYAECIDLCQAAIDADERAEAWFVTKLRAELSTGQYPEALRTYETGIARQPNSIQIRLLGQRVLRLNDRPGEADLVPAAIIEMVVDAPWRFGAAADRATFARALLLAGEDPRRVLEQILDIAKKADPTAAEPFVVSGELALEKSDFGLAAEAFEAAAKLAPDDPDLQLGLAKSYQDNSERATAALGRALELNPRHIDTLLFQADNLIDREADTGAEATLKQVLEINPREPRAWAYRAVLAHLGGDAVQETAARAEALASWRSNPEVDHTIGLKLSQKYRFAEGKAYQERSLAMSPTYQPAKVQLCQDLLRLGEEDQGWDLAGKIFAEDPYNVLAFNLTTLRDRLSGFRVLQTRHVTVRMDAREADIYGTRVLDLLTRARQKLTEKYEVDLPNRVYVEIFPQQKDFAIRTFGLPGGDGFLGVCFGNVITVNSPASRVARPANWEAILWHEFCHSATLKKSGNKMPRWLSEGISVYEEALENPTWGQTMTPAYRQIVLGTGATPVSQLSGAFLRPETPLDLQFAYYESSMVVRYIVDRFGIAAVRNILKDLGNDVKINDALAKHTEPVDKLDANFEKWFRTQAEQLASGADLSRKDVPADGDSAALAEWNRSHPKSFWGMIAHGRALLSEQKWESAIAILEPAAALYPAYAEADSPYLLMATAHQRRNDASSERAMLQKHADLSADAVEPRLRLLELATSANDWPTVKKTAEDLIAINPLTPAPNRYLAQAAEAMKNRPVAIDARRALLLMDPLDQSGQHYHLAKLLAEERQFGPAKAEVLRSLEETPRFRDAHRLLLNIVASTQPSQPAPLASPAATPEAPATPSTKAGQTP